MAHTVEIKEIINGVKITETIDAYIVEKLISYQSKPFLRTTNESGEETYQVLDIVGEIYNTPALATDFRIIDANDNIFIPANGVELIEYSKKIRAFGPEYDSDDFHIGNITTTSNSLTINLASDNVNWAYIDGSYYEKYYPDTFNFTPVTTGEKILIVYALPDAQVFHLAQGVESTEAVEPTYNGLFVARLLITSEGIDIVEAVSGFKEKTIDNFVIHSLTAGDKVVSVGSQMRLKIQSSGVVRIGGFYNEEDKLYNGCPISVRNDTSSPIEFYNAVDTSANFVVINSSDLPFSIKPGETANFAYRNGIVEIIKTGGSASFPETGNNGDILERDDTAEGGVKWSNRLTNAENSLQSQITTEKNRNDTQDGRITANETAITDLSLNQIEITTTASITTNTLGTITGKGQHLRSVLVKNGVNAINITLEASSNAKFEAIYYKKGSGAITFVAGAGVTLVKVANDGILNGAIDSNALVYRDGNTFYLYISNY